MRKIWIPIIVVALITSAVYAKFSATSETPENANVTSANGIKFIDEDWKLALKKAASEKKYIFVDAYASWCGPCKMLKLTTFKNKRAAEFFNEEFINISIDMEKGQGLKLAGEWGVQAYPTLIIFTPEGKPVIGTVGMINAEDLIKFGREGLQKGSLIK